MIENVNRWTFAIAPAVLSLTLAACGGSDGSSEKARSVPGGADPADVRVIDGWVTTLREGDVEGAAGYFAVPSVAQNGTQPLRLDTRDRVIAFNAALPCGARLTRAEPTGRFITATFRLTERPGGDCGAGVGGTARTAFLIRGGKIAQWRRLPDRPDDSAPSGPIV